MMALLFTGFSLAGLTWASCETAQNAGSQSAAVVSARSQLRKSGYKSFLTGQYEKALVCYTEALRAGEAQDPHNLTFIASDLNDIGILSEEMGRYDEARKYYLQELEVLKPLGEKVAASELAEAYLQLGGLALVQGIFKDAESSYNKAIAVLAGTPERDNPRMTKALAALGRMYAEIGKYDEASQFLGRARATAEKGMPGTHSVMINILDSQAALFSEVGKFAEAEKDWTRALRIGESAFGDNGLEYSAVLLHLGQLYTQLKDYRTAQAVLQRGYAAEQKTEGADAMDRAIITSALGNVYVQEHQLSKAQPFFAEATRALETRCSSVPLACAAVRVYVGDFYMAKKQWKNAEMQYEESFNIREKSLGAHPLVASSLMSMSHALEKMKRKKEAKMYAAQAQKIMSLPGNAQFNNDNTVDVRAFRTGSN